MPDNKSKVGGQDRSRVAAHQEYEIKFFAEENGITPDQVRELIERFGNDRLTLERQAAKLRGL